MSATLTSNEYNYLRAMQNSDYACDTSRDGSVDEPVWSWEPAEKTGLGTSAGGVAASLVKKGFAVCEGAGEDATIAMTADGWSAMEAHVAPTPEEVAACMPGRAPYKPLDLPEGSALLRRIASELRCLSLRDLHTLRGVTAEEINGRVEATDGRR